MSARTLAILFLLTLPGVVASQDVRPWIPPIEPVYVVAPNYSSESYGADGTKAEGTRLGDLLMIQIFPSVPLPSIEGARIDGKSIYQKGMRVALFVDGLRQGDVRVEAIKEHQCNSVAALVEPTIATVFKRIVGIATNKVGIESHAGSRRNVTASERTSAVQSATREFLRNHVATPLMTRINIGSLTAINVDDSRETTFVGSFFIQTKTERHDIFLIATTMGSKLSVEYSRYGKTTDLEDFKELESVELIDHLDLNGDRSDEIVLRVGGYESEGYEIYTRQLGKWQLVATGGEAGC
jgi:hypothetical protein